jgi:hypothetical protein
MILGDKPLIFEVVLSQVRGHVSRDSFVGPRHCSLMLLLVLPILFPLEFFVVFLMIALFLFSS